MNSRETTTRLESPRGVTVWMLAGLLATPAGVAHPGETVRGYFDPPVLVSELSSSAGDLRPVLSHDGRSLLFSSNSPEREGWLGGYDLYLAERPDPSSPFTRIRNLSEVNSSFDDGLGCLSADGCQLFFASYRSGDSDLYVAWREDPEGVFSAPLPLAELNDLRPQSFPWISLDGQELYFNPGDNRGIWVARGDCPGGCFGAEPECVFDAPSPVFNTTEYGEVGPCLSTDGRTLFYNDWSPGVRPGGEGELDIWMLRRSDPGEAFADPPINLGAPVNSALCEGMGSVSSDWPAEGSTIYFTSSPTCELDTTDIYRATWHRLPPPFYRGDCNDDGAVDISDAVSTLGVLFLGQGDPGCDDACDSNDDGAVDISDAITTLTVLFIGQGTIPVPGMDACGLDPTADELDCETFSQCP